MKINNLKINGFGNLENKEINFNNGINLISGNNENGKSTLLKFIQSIFFGISKSKAGKNYSDLEKYTPWYSNNYSGKINYSLDNNENYSIFRDFYSKESQVLNENTEDISYKYGLDKNRGSLCFYEQTHIDENLLCSTNLVEQGKSKLDEKKQSELIQKITNLITTGNDSISYQKSMDKLNKKLIEEIGTERTTGRPINIINEKINALQSKKSNLITNLKSQAVFGKENIHLENKIKDENNMLETLKQVKKHIETKHINEEKIKVNKHLQNTYNEKLKSTQNSLDEKLEEYDNIHINKKKIIVLSIIFILLFIISYYFIKASYFIVPLTFSLVVILASILIYDLIKKNEQKQTVLSDSKALKKLKHELENNIEELDDNIKEIEQIIKLETDEAFNELKNNYYNNLSANDLKVLLNTSLEDINSIIENQNQIIKNAELKLQDLKFQQENIDSQKNELEFCEMNLNNYLIEKQKLLNLQESINIAKEVLEIAYKKAKENITPNLQKNIENCISSISNGKYKKIFFNDESGLSVELNNGKVIPVELLSTGTIDQMYLALRLNILQEISKESLPIILDEPFSFYDDTRLKNTLNYLTYTYPNRQIIIFSCSNREINTLNELGIGYNYIGL